LQGIGRRDVAGDYAVQIITIYLGLTAFPDQQRHLVAIFSQFVHEIAADKAGAAARGDTDVCYMLLQ
jgi:hypothetical protein